MAQVPPANHQSRKDNDSLSRASLYQVFNKVSSATVGSLPPTDPWALTASYLPSLGQGQLLQRSHAEIAHLPIASGDHYFSIRTVSLTATP